MEQEYRELIAQEFENCVNGTIRRIVQNPDSYRPFHSALLSDEALFWSRFERSFSTSFGQRVVEQISKLAVQSNGAVEAQNQKVTNVQLSDGVMSSIDTHMHSLRANILHREPCWDQDLRDILVSNRDGSVNSYRVISDLWWVKDGINNYLSIKTVKPNIDQTAEAKRDLLKLKAADPNSNVYFGLYYNPFGEERTDYNWTPPKGIFNFNTDAPVLIGRDYWDTLGGEGFYEEILTIVKEVGLRTRRTISERLSPAFT